VAGQAAASAEQPGAQSCGGDAAATCPPQSAAQCPFCIELEGDPSSIYAGMMGARLPSRIVYEDEHFVIMPALGAFIEGGLLLLTKRHILSFAHLPAELFAPLEHLLAAVSRTLVERWGTPALVFEHGPAPERGKGVCCVDHAHLNIFPARATVHPHLAQRMHMPIAALADLAPLQRAEYGYLFVQELDGTRRAYDGELVPTQLVRRLITAQLGLPERWHWRDYPGYDELLATYHALHGRIRP
jgi:ATP adenylyltransferase